MLADIKKRNYFQNICLPTPTQFFVGKHEKNQSCPKLAEMARKLVENNFGFF